MTTPSPDRRALIAGLPAALALSACRQGGEAQAAAAARVDVPPLKQVAPFPVGACVMTSQLADAGFNGVLVPNFGQVTPEWEMKMEGVLKDDGGFDFTRADAIADFAAAHGMRLHAHTLIWYAQAPGAFTQIDGTGQAFADAYRNYILAVGGRYRGRAVGWDVVNEPVAEDGNGYRDCLWRKNLGMEYVARAFHHAREADPNAVLLMNDYNLELMPRKRASFLRLAESLLKAGAPLGGLGTQTHVSLGEYRPGMAREAIRDLASLGLPIHISELDVSTKGGRPDFAPPAEKAQHQARIVGEITEAFMDLHPARRYALTVWGVRDSDSWLRRAPHDGSDQPVLFDEAGRPKPAASAFVAAVSRG